MVAQIQHRLRTGCPVACSLDVFGDHWTLLIIRNLMFLGLHEYKDMLKSEELISSSLLSARLKKLEKDGLISSIPHPESKRRKLYYLKPMGKDLVFFMIYMVQWAAKYLNEYLDIPKDKMELLQKNPDGFVKITLDQIEAWEKAHLPQRG